MTTATEAMIEIREKEHKEYVKQVIKELKQTSINRTGYDKILENFYKKYR